MFSQADASPKAGFGILGMQQLTLKPLTWKQI